MSTVGEIACSDSRLKEVETLLEQWSEFNGQQYRIAEEGEFNAALISDRSVIKVPRNADQAYRTAMFEAYVVTELHGTHPPLAIPRIIESNTFRSPYFTAFSRVPGEVLSHERVRRLSVSEKRMLGERLGAFVAWFGSEMSFDTYNEIMRLSLPRIPNRESYIEERAHYALRAEKVDYAVADVLLDTHEEYKRRLADGSLEPTLIGHDDLGTYNLTFMRQDGQWVLHGVFDFGLTKPSTPERELRHVAPLGREALDAALESYEGITGYQPSRPLIGFWALAQTATIYSCLSEARNNASAALSTRRDLRYLLSERKQGNL